MNEMFSQKVLEAQAHRPARGMDIMGSLVKAAYGEKPQNKQPLISAKEVIPGTESNLSDSDILGNAFVMILAGHETTANSIHFTLNELAMNGTAQHQVQNEVASIFGDTPPETWDYDSNINKLLGGYTGAVLNEQLRLMPPVIAIPKHVPKSYDQTISLDGTTVILPAGTHINLCTTGAHRNPKYWPTRPSTISNRPDDLDDFKPERWFLKSSDDDKRLSHISVGSADDELEGFTEVALNSKLFRPVTGSYLPFSEGPRSCLGRRLAQVKIMAVLAVIFQKYSIELAVDEWASDEEVRTMSEEEKRILYEKAKNKARQTMRAATTLITLRLRSQTVPIRVVRKGEERFINIVG